MHLQNADNFSVHDRDHSTSLEALSSTPFVVVIWSVQHGMSVVDVPPLFLDLSLPPGLMVSNPVDD